MSKDGSPEISLRNRIISACAGSVLTSLSVNPFDVVRVRMQQSSAVEHISAPLGTVRPPFSVEFPNAFKSYKLDTPNTPTFNPRQLGINACCKDLFWYPSAINYCVADTADLCAMEATKKIPRSGSSTYNILRKIVTEEGALVPWRGVSLLLVQAIPANVIYFIAYERVRDEIGPYVGPQLGPLASGGIARTLASTMVSPLELLKTRLQSLHVPANKSPMTEALKSIKEMIAIDGYRALWSGLALTLWRDVPFSSIYWLVVESVRSRFPVRNHSNLEKITESCMAGILGGVVASIATTPFDVAKTRRQLGHSSCTSAHMSIPRFMGTIAKNEGWRTLFVGLAPRTMKVAPACAIMITSYEMGKRLLD